MPSAKEPIASYDNPQGPAPGQERVVAVTSDTVTTEHNGVRCEYHVQVATVAVGDMVDGRRLKARRQRIIPVAWSPFDGQDDD